jgi:hypothetical protein
MITKIDLIFDINVLLNAKYDSDYKICSIFDKNIIIINHKLIYLTKFTNYFKYWDVYVFNIDEPDTGKYIDESDVKNIIRKIKLNKII